MKHQKGTSQELGHPNVPNVESQELVAANNSLETGTVQNQTNLIKNGEKSLEINIKKKK